MARIYFAWVSDLYVPFDPAIHAIVAEPGVEEQMHTIRISQRENAAAVAEITFPNPGVGLLSASRRRFVLISESETDDPADAVLVFRGRITALPTELQSKMITVEAIAAPVDLEDRQRARAAELYGSPWSDRLYGDKPDDIVAALNARGATWYIDPVTHEVDVTDILTGDRVVDIGSDHAMADFVIKPGDAPVKSARLEVVVDWEQSAEGWLDISDSIPEIKSLSGTIDVSVVGGLGWETGSFHYRMNAVAPVEIERGYERKTAYDRWRYTGTTYHGAIASSGATQPGVWKLEMTGIGWTWIFYPNENYAGRIDNHSFRHNFVKEDAEAISVRMDNIQCTMFEVVKCTAEYAFRQQRREKIQLTMGCPVQDVLGAVAELDMGTLVLDDPTDDLDTPVWYPGMPVTAGQHVLFEDKRWLVTETHDRTYFYFRSVINGVLVSVTTPGFAPAPLATALDRKHPNLVGRLRGTAVIEHAAMLMRAALRWRLRGLQVTVRPGDWATVRDTTLRDEMACSHPRFGDIRGKVVAWTRIWAGGGRYATIDLGVPLGIGASAAGTLHGVDYAIDAGPVAEPVVAALLTDRLYAVEDVELVNDADQQGVLAGEAIARDEDPTNVIANNPTGAVVNMRDLTTARIIERKIVVDAEIVDSPKGFDTGV